MKRIFVLAAILALLAASCAAVPAAPHAYAAFPEAAAAMLPAPEVSQPRIPEVLTTAPTAPDTTYAILPSEAPALSGNQGIVAAESPGLSLEIISVTSPVKHGESATLKAQTLARARCSISVYYKSVRSALESLNEKTAEATGNVSWTWKTGTDLAPGSYRIEVVSRLGDKSESKTVYFTVT